MMSNSSSLLLSQQQQQQQQQSSTITITTNTNINNNDSSSPLLLTASSSSSSLLLLSASSSSAANNKNNNNGKTTNITAIKSALICDTKKLHDDNTGRPFIVYVVKLTTNNGQVSQVERRFSEFAKICDEIKKLNKQVASRFPSRFSNLLPRAESQLILQRRTALNEFLNGLVADARLVQLDSIRAFFKINNNNADDAHDDQQVTTTTTTANNNNNNNSDNVDLGTFEKKKATPNDFRFIKMVGKGSFAKVLQAEHLREHKLYAVKVIDKRDVVQRREVRHVMAERAILQRNKAHPFLVTLHYAFQTRDKLYFVLDFVNGGELFHHLQRDRRFSVERARFYAAEIATALGFLHSQNIIYRDLKPENILLDADGHIVLTDFGLCREGDLAATFCGTPEYLAPEVLRKERYTRAVDWWCLGCVLFEMLCGLPPFYSRDHQKMYSSILNDRLVFPVAAGLPSEAKALLNGLLDKDALTRVGSTRDVAEIQAHAFFAAINWERIVKKQVTPPFKPQVTSVGDTQNIDAEFTTQAIPESVRRQHDDDDDDDGNNRNRHGAGGVGGSGGVGGAGAGTGAGGAGAMMAASSYSNQFQGFSFVPTASEMEPVPE